MYHWIEGVSNLVALGFPYLNKDANYIDVYEPDNFWSDSNPTINFGSVQHRGFHKVPNGKRNDITSWSNCDEDWVRIQVPHNGFVTSIYTTAEPNGQDVDTELFLYDQNGTTLLASNDDKSANDLYSEILEVTLNQGTYWVRVVNKGDEDGAYLLYLERCGIECCYNDLATNVSHIDTHTGDYFLGVRGASDTTNSEEYFGNSLLVQGATFGLNTNSSNIAWFAFPPPQINSHYQISFCNQAEITLQAGTLEIGDPTNGRTAEVRFTEGTKLDLDGSSQIIVKNGSKLIIEAGAELSLAAGAEIILAGSDAVLEIEGKLQLGANQHFSIGTQSSQTPGYIRFLPGAQVAAGIGSQMVLGELNNFQKVLELAENAQISLPNTLTQFGISFGEVQMAPGSRLIVPTKAVFVNARFERLGSTGMHHGVLLSGNHAHQVTVSRFNNASTGLELNLNGNLFKPVLSTNQFNNNQMGLLVHGGGLLINSGSFTGNTQWALQLSALSAATDVNNVTFTNNANGIQISSANSHPVSIQGCSINQTTQTAGVGIEVLQGNVTCRSNNILNHFDGILGLGQNAKIRLACNTITNAQYALTSYNYSLFDLSNEARNVVSNSSDAAMYTDFGTILLQNGYNDFSNSNAYPILGSMAPNCYSLSTVNTTTGPVSFYDLPAEHNKFESGFYYPNATSPTLILPLGLDVDFHICDPFGLMWVDYDNTYPMFRKANNPNIAFVSCSQANPPWWHDVFNEVNLASNPTQWLVHSPLYPGIELKQAISTALNDITVDLDQPQQDSLALVRFKQILTANYANMDETGLALLATANAAMNYALTNAYALGILPVEYGVNPEPLDDAVYTILASLDDLIASHDDPMMKSKYALDKALLYRLAGHYETAIDELQNSEANGHTNFSYWDCMLQLEWSYFQGNIGAEQFALDAENCMGYFQARRQRRQPPVLPVYQNQATTTLVVSPNPTSNSSVFSFAACENAAAFRILDTQGRLVHRSELAAGATELTVDAADMPAGIYFAELLQPNQKVLRNKWVVSR